MSSKRQSDPQPEFTLCPDCAAQVWVANSSALTCTNCGKVVRRDQRAPTPDQIAAELAAIRKEKGLPAADPDDDGPLRPTLSRFRSKVTLSRIHFNAGS